jgi:hypothetical protein
MAIRAYEVGEVKSLREAASLFDVNACTIKSRLLKKPTQKDHGARCRLFSKPEETVLLEWIHEAIDRGFPARIDMLRNMALEIIQQRAAPGSLPLGPALGKNWHTRFLARYPDLSLKFSRNLDEERARCNNHETLSNWFKLVQETCEKYGIVPEDIYNMDETGFMMGIAATAKVMVRRGKHDRFVSQPGNRQWATVVGCISGAGEVLPPWFFFKGKQHLLTGMMSSFQSTLI